MTLHVAHSHHGGDEPHAHDSCIEALSRIQEFLHGELDEDTADVIREHLQACESCLDTYDVETAITTLIRRAMPTSACPDGLRARVMKMHVTTTVVTTSLQEPTAQD
ncbi:zf-HC2 domain-containing protein [Propionibacteriaceae bacterium G1746]